MKLKTSRTMSPVPWVQKYTKSGALVEVPSFEFTRPIMKDQRFEGKPKDWGLLNLVEIRAFSPPPWTGKSGAAGWGLTRKQEVYIVECVCWKGLSVMKPSMKDRPRGAQCSAEVAQICLWAKGKRVNSLSIWGPMMFKREQEGGLRLQVEKRWPSFI